VTARAAAIAAAALLVAGCQFGGLNSVDMPGTAGHGPGSYTVTVQMPDVATLPQNSPVMVDDVTVGSVSGIEAVQRADGSVYAGVRISLNPNVSLPANAMAKVAQTSLLGSQHVELAAPRDRPAAGRLAGGSVIELDSSGRYPTTEEVLSSLGLVVNKGNLGALQDITDETYAAVVGRAGTFAGLAPQLAELASSLKEQTADIVSTLEGVDRFSATATVSRSCWTACRKPYRCSTTTRTESSTRSGRSIAWPALPHVFWRPPRRISPPTCAGCTRSSSRSVTMPTTC
jgi:phospholipid/cholesterol/gamma-HCH transport system substrate-binding protein